QYDRGDTAVALATEREALTTYRQLFSGYHPRVAAVTNTIGLWLTFAGAYPEAERDLRTGLEMRRRLFKDNAPDVASSLENLAILQVATHRYSEALGSARAAIGIFTHAFSADNWRTAIAESAAGGALTGLGSYAEAQQLLDHSYAILRKDPWAQAAFRTLTQQYLQTLHEHQHGSASAAQAAKRAAQLVSPRTTAGSPR
ncbi:MAG: tetratricopeptide repeat protein, partial [Mycobacteriales bacterium]